MTDNQWGQTALLVTTVGGFLVTAWRENRNRRWATEDRRAATEEIVARAKAEAEAARILGDAKTAALAATLREDQRLDAEHLRLAALEAAHTIREHAVREAATIRVEQREQSATMLERIDSAKDAANSAFQEANHANAKIENLNQRLLAQADRRLQAPAPADDRRHGPGSPALPLQVEVVNQPLLVTDKPKG